MVEDLFVFNTNDEDLRITVSTNYPKVTGTKTSVREVNNHLGK